MIYKINYQYLTISSHLEGGQYDIDFWIHKSA